MMIEYFQIGFLVIVVTVGVGGFIWAIKNDKF